MKPVRSRVVALVAWVALVPLARAQYGIDGVPAPDWGDKAERERVVDLRHIVIDLRLDLERKTIDGSVTHRVAPLADGVTEVAFDAERLDIRGAAVDGRAVPFRTEGERVIVELGRAARDGELLDVRIDYSGSPSVGLYWVRPEEGYPDKPLQCWTQGQDRDNHHWVPLYDEPNDKATWETRLTVPAGFTAVSNGALLAVDEAPDGWRVFHHQLDQPNSTYLIAFAVGPWERYADTWRGRPVEYFVTRGVGEEAARRSFGVTPDILEFFSEFTGVEYPFAKYAQVAVAEFVVGGMENVTCTLQTDRTLHDATAALERSSQGLVAHEAAHQWFGDLVTCRTWSDLWLNEGFATYFDELFTEHKDGVDEFRIGVWGSQQGVLRADPEDEPQPMVTDFFSRSGDRRSHHVYSKGASVLHMLRFVLGDAAFRKGVRHYLEEHRFGSVDSRDFQLAIAEATGRNLEWFFEQWVHLAGVPSFEVSFDWDEAHRQGTLRVLQTQATGGLVPVFRTPVDVEFVCGGESDVRRIVIEEKEQTFSFALPERPSRVRFDKGGWLLKRLKFEKPVEEWIEIALEDGDVIGRLEAVIALKDVADERATGCLASVLASDDHHRVRSEAAEGLAAKGGAAAAEALLAALDDGEARVRRRAAESLAAFKDDAQVAAALQRVFAEDPAYGPRAAALVSLAKLGASDAFALCEQGLAMPSHQDEIASAALEGMVAIDPARAAAHVLAAAAYGGPIEVRHDALRSIGEIASQLTGEQRVQAVATARSGLADHWTRTRRQAIDTLADLEARETLDELDRIARDDGNARVREAAQRAAARIRGEEPGGAGRVRPGRDRGRDRGDAQSEIEELKKRIEALEKRAGQSPGQAR